MPGKDAVAVLPFETFGTFLTDSSYQLVFVKSSVV